MFYQIIALIIWGSSFIVAKSAYSMLSPAMLVQARLLIAALIMLPLALRYKSRIPKHVYKPLIILSLCHYVIILLLQFIGLQYTSAASAVTLIGLEPLIMVFVGHFLFHDPARWFHWLTGVFAFIGVAMLVMGGAESGGSASLLGSILILLSSFLFSVIWRPTRKLIDEIGVPAYTACSMVLGAILCLPFTLILADSFTIHWTWHGSLSILYMGIACSWLAYLLWNKGMSSVSANLSGLLTTLEPLFGVLLAVIFLGERLSLLSWSGAALIIFATITAALIPRFLDKAA
ncbi:DMT family transporter [Wielerella bovis]|uniref:DMT family transporter n=1 Tax=Wielerella bovis TaxID=2917790 RepID=UPI002018A8E5|nr:EamA family transporter [Wielerella bovis]ULJ59435.1 EamA family transporter [Wielerella bovis]